MDSEVERLMVRLGVDDAGYGPALDRSMRTMLDWAKAAGAMEEAQKHADAAQEDAKRHLSKYGDAAKIAQEATNVFSNELRNLSSVVGALNPSLGFAVTKMGNIGSAASRSVGSVNALAGSLRSLVGLAAAHPAAAAALGVGAVAVAGVAAYIGEGLAERDESIKYSNRAFGYEQLRMGVTRRRESEYMNRQPLVDPTTGFGQGASQATMEREKIMHEEKVRRMEDERRVEEERLRLAQKEIGMLMEKLDYREFLDKRRLDDLGYMATHLSTVTFDRPVTLNALEQARTRRDAAQGSLNDLSISGPAENAAQAIRINQANAARMSGVSAQIRAMQEQTAQFRMSDMDFERWMVDRNTEGSPEPLRDKARRDFGRQQRRTEDARTEWTSNSIGRQVEGLREGRREILEPLNLELKIQNEVNQADRAYYEQHKRHLPDVLRFRTEGLAIQHQHNRLTAEGRSVYEAFMLPMERMMFDQQRLRQQRDAGGFEGPSKQWAMLRSMEQAYGVAHKDFSQYRLGQQYEAIQSNTSQYTRGMWEYTMGSTAIPLDQIKAMAQVKKIEKVPEPKDMFSYAQDVAGVVSNDLSVTLLKAIAKATAAIAEQGRKQVDNCGKLQPANL
jgi:hypothetical protein